MIFIFFWIFHSARKVCTAHLCVCRERILNLGIANKYSYLQYCFKNVWAIKTKAVTKLRTHGFNVSAHIGKWASGCVVSTLGALATLHTNNC